MASDKVPKEVWGEYMAAHTWDGGAILAASVGPTRILFKSSVNNNMHLVAFGGHLYARPALPDKTGKIVVRVRTTADGVARAESNATGRTVEVLDLGPTVTFVPHTIQGVTGDEAGPSF